MIDLAHDLSVFFNEADFAQNFTHIHCGEERGRFSAIFNVVDDALLDNLAQSAQFSLDYAVGSVILVQGDMVRDSHGFSYRVRNSPVRIADGLQYSVQLSRA